MPWAFPDGRDRPTIYADTAFIVATNTGGVSTVLRTKSKEITAHREGSLSKRRLVEQWVVKACALLVAGGFMAEMPAAQIEAPTSVPSGQVDFETKEPIPIVQLKETFKVDPVYTEEAKQVGLEGTVVLYAEVTPYGEAEGVRVLRSLGLGLDQKAVEAVRQWRFEPAFTGQGQPMRVATTVLVNFCLPAQESTGIRLYKPENKAIFRLEEGITPPRVSSRVEPTYTEKARVAKLQGVVQLYCEVTAEGRVENLQVLRGLGMGMDEAAASSLRQWRFHPAMRGGQPIPVILTVEVNFSLQ
jgi:TonB family protein